MFLYSYKIAVLISVVSFAALSSGLFGIYLLLKNFFSRGILMENSSFGREKGKEKENKNLDIEAIYSISAGSHKTGKLKVNKPGNNLPVFFEKRKKHSAAFFFLISCAVSYFFFKNVILSVFMAIIASGIFIEFADSFIRKRREALDMQLIEFITNSIIMLKAGKEIRQVFRESVYCIKKPLSSHIRVFVNEVELNTSMEAAIDNFAVNVGGREASLLANAIKINHKIGGNLLFILENIISTIRENIKIRSNIKTQTAQSRFSGNFISLFPIAGFIFMYFFLNSPLKEFLLTKAGNILIASGAVLEFAGFYIIRRLLREEKA